MYLWDLMPGARSNESHVFTRVRECRNQQLVQARQADAAGMTLKPYSAKDTLTFLEKHFVQDSGDQYIINGRTFFVTPDIRALASMSGATLLVPSSGLTSESRRLTI